MEKVVDKVTGILERLADIRMLVLGLTAVFYLDIYLIRSGTDPHALTFGESLARIQALSVGEVADFVMLYALLMGATFPGLRFVYTAVRSSYSKDRTSDQRKQSNWAFGLVCFSICDFIYGRFFAPHAYSGLARYIVDAASGDGLLGTVLGSSVAFFFFFCFALAFEPEF